MGRDSFSPSLLLFFWPFALASQKQIHKKKQKYDKGIAKHAQKKKKKKKGIKYKFKEKKENSIQSSKEGWK